MTFFNIHAFSILITSINLLPKREISDTINVSPFFILFNSTPSFLSLADRVPETVSSTHTSIWKSLCLAKRFISNRWFSTVCLSVETRIYDSFHLRMFRTADDHDRVPCPGVLRHNAVDFLHKGAGGVHYLHPAPFKDVINMAADTVGADDHGSLSLWQESNKENIMFPSVQQPVLTRGLLHRHMTMQKTSSTQESPGAIH